MTGKAAAPGTAVLLVTANVGSLFDDVSAAPSAREERHSRPGIPLTLALTFPHPCQGHWTRKAPDLVQTPKPRIQARKPLDLGPGARPLSLGPLL